MPNMWIEAIGLAAGFIGIIAWIPQIKEVWIYKRHEGISIVTFATVAFALCLWLIYGILIKSLAMIIANILTLSIIASIVIGVVRLRRPVISQ